MVQDSARLEKLSIAFVVSFGIVGLALTFWQLRAPELLARDDNPRLLEARYQVRRGAILDGSGTVLVDNAGTPNRPQRIHHYPEAAFATGYFSFQYAATGVEASYNDVLTGQTEDLGLLLRRRFMHTPPQGRDVRLTLNVEWQQIAAQLMGQNRGAIVLMSVTDGAIRVMVSHPSFNPNRLDEEFDLLVASEDAPLLNRATQGQYAPGGTLLPLIQAGANAPSTPDSSALTNQLADSLGTTGIDGILDGFRLRTPPDLAIDVAAPLTVPSRSARLAIMGQENLAVSPLQMLIAWSALGNNGILPVPRLVSAVETEDGEFQAVRRSTRASTVAASERAASRVLAAQPRYQNISEINTLALSGPSGEQVAWYLAMAPASQPQLGLVIVVEDAVDAGVAAHIGRTLLGVVLSGEGAQGQDS